METSPHASECRPAPGLNAWQELSAASPELAASIDASITDLFRLSGLDEKTRQLVYIAAQTAVCYPLAVKYHVPLALAAGASADEIMGAAALTVAAAGPKGFVKCVPAILEEVRRYGDTHGT